MLALSRRVGEWVEIGENISIYITSIDRNQVKIGIEAPKDVVILRGELAELERRQYE